MQKIVTKCDKIELYKEYPVKDAASAFYYLGLELRERRPDLQIEVDENMNSLGIYNGSGLDILIIDPTRMIRYLHSDGAFGYFISTDSGSTVTISNNRVSLIVR